MNNAFRDMMTAWRTMRAAGKPPQDSTGTIDDSLAAAVARLWRMRAVRARLHAGYYHDHLIFMPALPRSGSTALAVTLGHVQEQALAPNRPRGSTLGTRVTPPYAFPHDFLFRPETLLWMPDGGVFKRHVQPDPTTFGALEVIQCAVVATIRHPASYLLSHGARTAELLRIGRKGRQTCGLASDAVAWFQPPAALDANAVDAAALIEHWIMSGYLTSAVQFMGRWADYADRTPERSTVVRFEDFRASPLETTAAVASHCIPGAQPNMVADAMKAAEITREAQASTLSTEIQAANEGNDFGLPAGLQAPFRAAITAVASADPGSFKALAKHYPDLEACADAVTR